MGEERKRIGYWAFGVLGVVLLVALALTSSLSPVEIDSDDGSDEVSTLLVVRGEVSVAGDRLTISDPRVEWFTNRPARQAGFYHPDALSHRWSSWGFDDEPPNATLSGSGAVVELTDPRRPTNREVSFQTTPIRGALRDGQLGSQALFIDFIEDGTENYDPLECTYWINNNPYEGTTGISFDNETDRSKYGLNCSDYNALVTNMMKAIDDPTKTEDRSFALEVQVGSEDSWSCSGRVSGTLQNASMKINTGGCRNLQHNNYPEPGFTLEPRY